MERLSALSARLLPGEGRCDAVSHSAEILDYLTPCAGLRAATSGKLTVGPRPVLVTLKYESQAIYKGSPLYARFAVPTFFTFSCFLGAVTLTSLSLSPSLSSLLSLSLSSSLVHAAVASTHCSNLQAVHANVRVLVVVSSRQPQTPRRKMLLVPLRKVRDRVPRILRKLFTKGSYEMTFTHHDSLTFTNISRILLPRFWRVELKIWFWKWNNI